MLHDWFRTSGQFFLVKGFQETIDRCTTTTTLDRPMPFTEHPERTKMAVGQRMGLLREALGLDQKEFSRRAGLKPTTYNQYELGINMPELKSANKICDAYHVTLDFIYRGDSGSLKYETEAAIAAIKMLRKKSQLSL